ncbi:MAG: alpha/beta hydrolase [Leptospirales bacterium]|nr:alpha/beta hydrolase [Leptospirales bacterium]
MSTAPRELRIALQHLQLAARDWGDPEAPPILAFHGWLDNAASFDLIAPLLGDFRLIAIDFPGHGRSEHAARGAAHSFIEYPGLVLEALDALGFNCVNLLGHSMGAGVLSLLAGAFPERVRRLALIEGLGPLSDLPETAPQRLREALLARNEKTTGRRNSRGAVYRDLEHAVRARRLAGRLSEEAARLLVERNLKPAPGGFVFRSDARLKQPSLYRMTEEQVSAFLSGIRCPAILISGSESEFKTLYPQLMERARLLPQLRTLELPGGHHVHLDAPEQCAQALAEFFGAPD